MYAAGKYARSHKSRNHHDDGGQQTSLLLLPLIARRTGALLRVNGKSHLSERAAEIPVRGLGRGFVAANSAVRCSASSSAS